jgi:hypothetical protein
LGQDLSDTSFQTLPAHADHVGLPLSIRTFNNGWIIAAKSKADLSILWIEGDCDVAAMPMDGVRGRLSENMAKESKFKGDCGYQAGFPHLSAKLTCLFKRQQSQGWGWPDSLH